MAKSASGMDRLAGIYRALRVQLKAPVFPPHAPNINSTTSFNMGSDGSMPSSSSSFALWRVENGLPLSSRRSGVIQ